MKSLKRQKGFTLIELVIVLAIAALIIAAIFLAVSGAQRSQRDSNAKNSAGQVLTALENYASNNSGAMPAAGASLGGSYLNGIVDPLGGAPKAAAVGAAATAGAGNEIQYSGTAVCSAGNGNPGSLAAGNNRQGAVVYWSESAGASECISNQ